MISIDLHAKYRVKKWLRDNEIDIRLVQTCTNIILNQIRKYKKSQYHKIEIKQYKTDTGSGYFFGFDELHLTGKLNQNGWSKEKRFDTFVSHYLHELRHWIQDNMLGVAEDKLNYTDEDANKLSPVYCKNKWEVDALRFEKRYKQEFIKLYRMLERLSNKKDLI
tara:strand:- start:1045 stop:1536 length:492 start_codon:yes stop_codon:yes gene_type:complete